MSQNNIPFRPQLTVFNAGSRTYIDLPLVGDAVTQRALLTEYAKITDGDFSLRARCAAADLEDARKRAASAVAMFANNGITMAVTEYAPRTEGANYSVVVAAPRTGDNAVADDAF